MITKFAIFRRETSGGYSSRGPVAAVMTLEQAHREIARLRAKYPHQEFVILGEIAEPALAQRSSAQIQASDP
jgi:hypothetical protein